MTSGPWGSGRQKGVDSASLDVVWCVDVHTPSSFCESPSEIHYVSSPRRSCWMLRELRRYDNRYKGRGHLLGGHLLITNSSVSVYTLSGHAVFIRIRSRSLYKEPLNLSLNRRAMGMERGLRLASLSCSEHKRQSWKRQSLV